MSTEGTGADAGRAPRHPGFDACFEANYSRLLAFALRRVEGRAVAEDVVAETFAVAWRRRDAMPRRAPPWLYGIAIRVIANQHRSSRRQARLAGRLSGEPDPPGHDPAELVAARDELARAFAALSEADREALRLIAWEGLDSQEAATALGCSRTAFRVRLHRARRKLRDLLYEEGAEAHAV